MPREPAPAPSARDGLDLTCDDGIVTANGLLQPQLLDLALGQVVEAVEQVVGQLRAGSAVEPEGRASELVNGRRVTPRSEWMEHSDCTAATPGRRKMTMGVLALTCLTCTDVQGRLVTVHPLAFQSKCWVQESGMKVVHLGGHH